ncbi:GDP-mannose 4,6-dehydratase [Oceanicola sp. D3]|uniref:GDP-mannose 4,6-dehydratase n=1 Tax=Oceanicola sp. D3 TaxID=2587163 RepID=UPI00111D2A88|nr:GDP-mannose 4,6-dehydratase [Oceanicola sp. D3]QDC10925.1 GDP-mannose 4,6-dehydratase [Oceanicola sp. D3]
MAKILAFLDGIKPIFSKIGALAKKLRQSIDETAERIMTKSHRVERSARYWRKRLDELAQDVPGAHGPQRHEGDVTDQALLDRILHGIDPMSGTRIDAVTGKKHTQVRTATKFNAAADFVRAYDHIVTKLSTKLHDNAAIARYEGLDGFPVEFPISDLFRTGVNTRFKGYERIGPKFSSVSKAIDFEG